MALSSYYQGIEPTNLRPFVYGTPYPLPEDDPALLPPSTPNLDPRVVDATCAVGDAFRLAEENVKDTKLLSIRMTPTQASKLKELCVEALAAGGELVSSDDGKSIHLSTQDAVIALVLSIVNRFAKAPVNHLYSLWNVSG